MKTERITSKDNLKFKTWKTLLTARGQKEEGQCLISGDKLVQEFLLNRLNQVRAILVLEKNFDDVRNKLAAQAKSSLTIFVLSAELMNELDVLGTHSEILIADRPSIEPFAANTAPQGFEIVCPLQDPQNLGAVARSAVAFGCKTIILTQESSDPFLPKAIKASSGAVFVVNWKKWPQSLHSWPEETQPVGLDMRGQSLDSFAWTKDFRFTVGEEGQGLPQNWKGQRLHIPMENVESLNAAVATSLVAWEYQKHFKK